MDCRCVVPSYAYTSVELEEKVIESKVMITSSRSFVRGYKSAIDYKAIDIDEYRHLAIFYLRWQLILKAATVQ